MSIVLRIVKLWRVIGPSQSYSIGFALLCPRFCQHAIVYVVTCSPNLNQQLVAVNELVRIGVMHSFSGGGFASFDFERKNEKETTNVDDASIWVDSHLNYLRNDRFASSAS